MPNNKEAARLKVRGAAPISVESKVSAEALAKAKRKFHAKIATSVAKSFDSLKRTVVRLNHAKQFVSDVLPMNCRFFQMGESTGSFIIEYQPMRRTIFIGSEEGKEDDDIVNVPFPYFYFYIAWRRYGAMHPKVRKYKVGKYTIVGRGVGARTSPLTSIDDELGCLPLCHTMGNTYVCLPMPNFFFNSPQNMVDEFVETFWQSRFVYKFEQFSVGRKIIKSYADWEKLDVMEMLQAKLQNASQVKSLLRRYEETTHSAKLQSAVGRSEFAVQNAIKDAVAALDL